MFTLNKLRADHVLDFAAEELKKYLRMLMPHCGEIDIAYAPDAEDGFRRIHQRTPVTRPSLQEGN